MASARARCTMNEPFPEMSTSFEKNNFAVATSGKGIILEPLPETSASFGKFSYPSSFRGNITEELHGCKVQDPYRWLEDPDAAAVEDWVQRQVKCTDAYMEPLSTTKQQLNKEMSSLWDYEKFGTPFRRGNFYFFFKNDGMQNQYVLYKCKSIVAARCGKAEVLLDMNKWREDGTASINTYEFSEDGKYLAYAVSLSGSDWTTIYVRDVATGKDLKDTIKWAKFTSISWSHDHAGFFYSRYPAPVLSSSKEDAAGAETAGNKNHMVYYHELSTVVGITDGAGVDTMVYRLPQHPEWMFEPVVSDDGLWLLICANDSCDPVNSVYYARLLPSSGSKRGHGFVKNVDGTASVVKLVDNFDAKFEYLTNEGNIFFFTTNFEAPKNRVISMDLPMPDAAGAAPAGVDLAGLPRTEVLPQHESDVLKNVLVAHDAVTKGPILVVQYLHDCKHVLQVRALLDRPGFSPGAVLKEVQLPAPGSIGALRGRKCDSEFFYSFTSFLYPGTVFRGDLSKTYAQSVVFDMSVSGFTRDDFETRQVFYPSKDGTKIPMFITAPRHGACTTAEPRPGNATGGTKRNPTPALLYGYGGFNISLTPSFSVTRLTYMKCFGATFAMANLRGGGEYGTAWHKAGQKLNKQNVFDDFHAAAEYLVKNEYTTKQQLAIMGGSNGGLLVAACVTQRPELYAAAVSQVPVADMLRFHKFTIGYAWCSDFGNAEKDKKQFEYMIGYSPVHNTHRLKGKQIPATLVCTADHDDRVVPLHSYKFIAALQHAVGASSEKPALIRIEVKAGHGGGKPTSKVIQEYAEVWAFVAANTGATMQ